MLHILNRINAVRAAVIDSSGTFCTIKYRAKDGHVRRINGRTGVVRYLKHKDGNRGPGFWSFTFYDVKRAGYRTLKPAQVLSITWCKRTQVFGDSI